MTKTGTSHQKEKQTQKQETDVKVETDLAKKAVLEWRKERPTPQHLALLIGVQKH